MIKKFDTLYKRDTKGKIRQWTIHAQGNKFWTEGGLVDMKMNVAKPTSCHSKNLGQTNETSPEAQAQLEAQAKWDINLDKEYFENIELMK